MASAQSTSRHYEDIILRRFLPRWRPSKEPEAWAQYRSQMIKSLPWFTQPQGGICSTASKDKSHWRFSNPKYLTGLLIGTYTPINAYIDAEVIITSLYNAKEGGKLTLEDESRINALKNNVKDKRLLGCVVAHGATVKREEQASEAPESSKGKKPTYQKTASRPFFCCPMPKGEEIRFLGFYIITDYWDAYTSTEKIVMFRLERWRLEEKAWFASSDSTHDPPSLEARDYRTKADTETCGTCNMSSPRMFEEYFLCRNTTCSNHWMHGGKRSKEVLTYTKKFLQQREQRDRSFQAYGAYKSTADVIAEDDLDAPVNIPDNASSAPSSAVATPVIGSFSAAPSTLSGAANTTQPPLGATQWDIFPETAIDFEKWWKAKYDDVKAIELDAQNWRGRMRNLSRGFWCPKCGMLNARRHWEKWECANADCGYSKEGFPKISSAKVLTELYEDKREDWHSLPCYVGTGEDTDFIRHHFDLGGDCKVTCILPKSGTNAGTRVPQRHGSDWMLQELQTHASTGVVDLQKQFAKAPLIGTLTNHYIHNFGRDYHLTVDIQQRTTMNDAPLEIRTALAKANDLCRPYQLPGTIGHEDFNQCYLAGYFAKEHMGWHADGETGLGSVIATWTLGGEGKMRFGASDEQYWGKTGGRGDKVIEDDALLEGVLYREERKQFKEAYGKSLVDIRANPKLDQGQKEQAESQARQDYREKLQKLLKVVKKPARGDPKTLLSLPLTHGSIVVMHGENFQKYFRHKVDVSGPLRFALTFRCITDEHDAAQRREKERKDTIREAQVAKGGTPKGERSYGTYPYVPDADWLVDFNDQEEHCEERKETEWRKKGKRTASGEAGAPTDTKRRKPEDDEEEEGDGGGVGGKVEGLSSSTRTKVKSSVTDDTKGKGKGKAVEQTTKSRGIAKRGRTPNASKAATRSVSVRTSKRIGELGTKPDYVGKTAYTQRKPSGDPMDLD